MVFSSAHVIAQLTALAVLCSLTKGDVLRPIIRPACKVSFEDTEGVCINLQREIKMCPPLRKILLEKNFTEIDAALCDEPNLENLNKTMVCCPIHEFEEPYTHPSDFTGFHEHRNFELVPHLTNSDCGKSLGSNSDRIFGGTNVLPGSSPWMARLGVVMSEDEEIHFACSGSIISSRYILTAAHCFKHGKLRLVRLAETDENVNVECLEMHSTICQEAEDYEIDETIIHPNYTGKIGSGNDIALIRLKEPIRNLSSPFTRPVCLPFIEEFHLPDLENDAISATGSKSQLIVQGWGKESNDENIGTTTLKEVYVPLRSNVYCRHIFLKNNLTITDEQICAGGTKNKGSCAGDSGSPLTLESFPKDIQQSGRRTFQLGIVSYGRQLCGLENSPVVYTRVRSYLKWILDSIHV